LIPGIRYFFYERYKDMHLEEQSFDVFQRFYGMEQLLRALELKPGAQILDIGGYPGTFADYIKKALPGVNLVTLDQPQCQRGDYIRGSADALPFAKGSFDVVLSSDTLEHLSASRRVPAIIEMIRASRRWVILGAPFFHPCVELAEKSINALHEKCLANPNPWLKEHIENRLPKKDEALKILEHSGCEVAIFPNGSVVSWYILEAAQILLDTFPYLSPVKPSLSLAFNKYWAKQDDCEPAYRHIILADKTGKLPDQAKSLIKDFPEEESEPVIQKLTSLQEIAEQIAKTALSTFSDQEKAEEILSRGYIGKLEEILSFQKQEMENLQSKLNEKERHLKRLQSSPLFRLLSKLGFF